jgi:hypothetical protein
VLVIDDTALVKQGRGETAWLVCEHRASGKRKYYLSNHEEIGLDHFKGRRWRGLHHHALMTMIAFAFLQHLRLGEKTTTSPGPPPSLEFRGCKRLAQGLWLGCASKAARVVGPWKQEVELGGCGYSSKFQFDGQKLLSSKCGPKALAGPEPRSCHVPDE